MSGNGSGSCSFHNYKMNTSLERKLIFLITGVRVLQVEHVAILTTW